MFRNQVMFILYFARLKINMCTLDFSKKCYKLDQFQPPTQFSVFGGIWLHFDAFWGILVLFGQFWRILVYLGVFCAFFAFSGILCIFCMFWGCPFWEALFWDLGSYAQQCSVILHCILYQLCLSYCILQKELPKYFFS